MTNIPEEKAWEAILAEVAGDFAHALQSGNSGAPASGFPRQRQPSQ